MSLGPISIQRLNLVHPTLSYLIQVLSARMSEPIGVTQGQRSYPEQHALWAQGRLDLAEVNALRAPLKWAPLTLEGNIVVTAADAGYGWHNFGLAVDVVPFESSGQPDWNETHSVWTELVQKGTELGLTSGKSWRDEPHFQLTGKFPVAEPTDEVRTLFEQGGVQAVWNATGIEAPPAEEEAA